MVRYVTTLLMLLLMMGCSDKEVANINTKEEKPKTLQESLLDSKIPTGDIIHLEEKEDFAFSLYRNEEGTGLEEFKKDASGWRSTGGSSITYESIKFPRKKFTALSTSWISGASSNSNSSYVNVCYGEVNDSAIKKISVKMGDAELQAKIVTQNGASMWFTYQVSKGIVIKCGEAVAYMSDGKKLREEK